MTGVERSKIRLAILVIIGLVLVAGSWWWEKHKRDERVERFTCAILADQGIQGEDC